MPNLQAKPLPQGSGRHVRGFIFEEAASNAPNVAVSRLGVDEMSMPTFSVWAGSPRRASPSVDDHDGDGAFDGEREVLAHERKRETTVRPPNQLEAASFMIFTIVCSTSCATPSSCGALNIARSVVGFKVARMVLPPSS